MGSRELPEKGRHARTLSRCKVKTVRSGSQSDRARNQDMETSYHTSRIGKEDPANLFKRSWPSKERGASRSLQSPSLLWSPEETKEVEVFTTLKRVCPSEYQGAQGAFKDSMIH